MARGFTVQLEGLEKEIARLKKQGIQVEDEVDAEVQDAALYTELRASQRVPVDTGALRASISNKKIAKMNYEIVAQKNYAAYIEFGTGGLVDIPSGLEAYAAQFKGKGIKKVNLPARPYLFNSFVEAKAKLMKELQRILKKER
jgi:phage gpG-like protein